MRTSVSLDEDLHRRAKAAAARTGRTLSEIVSEALRTQLDRDDRVGQRAGGLPVFGGSGLHVGVDLEDRDGVMAAMDDPHDGAAD